MSTLDAKTVGEVRLLTCLNYKNSFNFICLYYAYSSLLRSYFRCWISHILFIDFRCY